MDAMEKINNEIIEFCKSLGFDCITSNGSIEHFGIIHLHSNGLKVFCIFNANATYPFRIIPRPNQGTFYTFEHDLIEEKLEELKEKYRLNPTKRKIYVKS